jgi:hypothetical protein
MKEFGLVSCGDASGTSSGGVYIDKWLFPTISNANFTSCIIGSGNGAAFYASTLKPGTLTAPTQYCTLQYLTVYKCGGTSIFWTHAETGYFTIESSNFFDNPGPAESYHLFWVDSNTNAAITSCYFFNNDCTLFAGGSSGWYNLQSSFFSGRAPTGTIFSYNNANHGNASATPWPICHLRTHVCVPVLCPTSRFVPSAALAPSQLPEPTAHLDVSPLFTPSSPLEPTGNAVASASLAHSSRPKMSQQLDSSASHEPSSGLEPTSHCGASALLTHSSALERTGQFGTSPSLAPSDELEPSGGLETSASLAPSNKLEPSGGLDTSPSLAPCNTAEPTGHFDASASIEASSAFEPNSQLDAPVSFAPESRLESVENADGSATPALAAPVEATRDVPTGSDFFSDSPLRARQRSRIRLGYIFAFPFTMTLF